MTEQYVPEHVIRGAFSRAMSEMYRAEVPLYGDLLEIVERVNADVLAKAPLPDTVVTDSSELARLGEERHGAIRLGTAEELAMMRRAFAVMGLHPVGYYDLSVAGVPVHSTAFRPVDPTSLNLNPFRVFTSLLRLELIEDQALRVRTAELLAERAIFSDAAIKLIEQHERDGGLVEDDANAFVEAILETFRWHSQASVEAATYEQLLTVHRLVADVACFKGPHINHLTPRTLDIDAAQWEMTRQGMGAKATIEGPPSRDVPILLRQTSFKALDERIEFQGSDAGGSHTARFGEIEQRGVALTPAGRALYDELLALARGSDGSQAADYGQRLTDAFKRFPDTLEELRRARLAYFTFSVVTDGDFSSTSFDLEDLIATGAVRARPITYEDFLPVSAAGIFQSNLGGGEQRAYAAAEAQAQFEEALGASVANPFQLYEALQAESIDAVKARWNISETTPEDIA